SGQGSWATARVSGQGGRRGRGCAGLRGTRTADARSDHGCDRQRRQYRHGPSGKPSQLARRAIAHGPRLIAATSIQTKSAAPGIHRIRLVTYKPVGKLKPTAASYARLSTMLIRFSGAVIEPSPRSTTTPT